MKFGPCVEGDLADRDRLDAAFREHAPVAVMHFAALSQVGEAMREPGKYWRGNVSASLNLIEATLRTNVFQTDEAGAPRGTISFKFACAAVANQIITMTKEKAMVTGAWRA